MFIPSTQAAEGYPRRAFTVYDINRMIAAEIIAEDDKIELIEGDIAVTPQKVYEQDVVRIELLMAMMRARPRDAMVAAALTVQLSEDTLIDGDIVVFPRGEFKSSPAKFGCFDDGKLLLVVEIAALNIAYDRVLKARLYARYGVRELWVIDARRRVTWIHTAPTAEGWGSIVEHGPDDILTTPALAGFAVKLCELE